MKRIPLLILLSLFFSISRASALELTLQECVSRALQHNSRLKSFEGNLEAAREEEKISRAGFFPALKFKGNYSLIDKPERLLINRDTFTAGIPPQDIEISTGSNSSYNFNLVLAQPLFTGGGLTHAYRKSKALSEESRLRYERQKREIILEVEKSFHEALNAQLYSKVVEKAAVAKKERLRVLWELQAEGYAGKEEVLQQETDILFTELEMYKGKTREEIALSRLRDIIRYEGGDGLLLKGSSFNGTFTASLGEVREAAARNREELKAALSRVESADEDVAIAKSGFYPQTSLEGKYILQKETNIARQQVWMLTAQLEWSLFEWGKTTAEVRKKAAQRQRVHYEREELEKTVMLEAEQAWRSLKEGEKTVAAHKKRVTTAEYRLDVTAERYAEGKVKLAEVIEMEAEFIKAYNEYLIAVNVLDVELAHLEASISQSLEQWLRTEEIYKPDFDSFEKRLKELSPRNRDRNPGYSSLGNVKTSTDNNSSPAPLIAESGKHPVVSNHAILSKNWTSPASQNFVTQIGSFKLRRNAERHVKDLSVKIPGKKIGIHSVGKFHKVRVAGFGSREEAEEAMKSAGIEDFLVLRKSDEY